MGTKNTEKNDIGMKNQRLENILKTNIMIKVRYLGENDPLSLLNGKVYDARVLKRGWYGIVDETKEEYAYPPELFETLIE